MNSNLVSTKIDLRLNKLGSSDYDHLNCVTKIEAFNKGQREWVRRQLHGSNMMREGDEQTKRRVDDLQILLTTKELSLGKNNKNYIETGKLPSDYLEYKRLEIDAEKDSCKDCLSKVYLIEEGNVPEWLNDSAKEPSFEWRETFHTIADNKLRIYHASKFQLSKPVLHYYRQPKDISIAGCLDINGDDLGNIDPEFKDDIVELLIDEAVKILASDIESWNQNMSAKQRETENN